MKRILQEKLKYPFTEFKKLLSGIDGKTRETKIRFPTVAYLPMGNVSWKPC